MIKQKWAPKDKRRIRLLDIDCFTTIDDKLPSFDASSGKYLVGYFQNEINDQWVFVGDKMEKKATFWSGDAGWDEPDGDIVEISEEHGVIRTMILNGPEKMWINSCLATLHISVRI